MKLKVYVSSKETVHILKETCELGGCDICYIYSMYCIVIHVVNLNNL
jgi:hypothetical protein